MESQEDKEFLRTKHVEFLAGLDKQDKNSYEYCATEHIRVQGVAWGLGAADMLNAREVMPKTEKIVDWVLQCYDTKSGGFGGNIGHDPNVIDTQWAVYVLALCDSLARADVEGISGYLQRRQHPDGSFELDEWGQSDTRVTFSALSCLSLLNKLECVDLDKAAKYILSCRNFDAGFGCVPGAESHAGYIFTCVGSLMIANRMHLLSRTEWDELAWFLSERQCDSGGLNGRPEKQADVCYSWWVLSTLFMLERDDWIDKDKLVRFIYKCQDPETGGIADRPDNIGDVYHTFFGLAGLSMMKKLDPNNSNEIDHLYALPKRIIHKLIRDRSEK